VSLAATPSVAVVVSAHPVDDMRVYVREARTMALYWPVTVLGTRGPARVEGENLRTIVAPRLGVSRLVRMTVAPWVLTAQAVRRGADLLYIHDPEMIPATLILGRTFGKRIVYDNHESFPEVMLSKHWLPRWSRPIVKRLMEGVNRLVARTFDAVITTTERQAQPFREAGGCRVEVVRNTPDTRLFASLAGQGGGKRYDVIHVGTISSLRSDTFVDLVRGVEAKRPGTTWRFVGLSDETREAMNRALSQDFGECVMLEGRIGPELVPDAIAGARIGVNWHPDTEQFRAAIPNKLLEYMSTGVPSVTTEVVELADELSPDASGVHGVFYAPRDMGGFIAAVVELLSGDDSTLETLGTASQRYASAHLDWSADAALLLDVVRGVFGVDRGDAPQ